MKTKALLDKYIKILAPIIGCKESDLLFMIGNKKIEEIEYFEPEKDDKGEETGVKIRYTRWNDWSEGTYRLLRKNNDTNEFKEEITSFELYKMPHCCAILVSCKSLISSKYRNKRIGTIMNTFRQDIGRLLGYSLLFCTDIEKNVHQRQLLATNGWKDIYEVKNKRTQNKVFLSVINL